MLTRLVILKIFSGVLACNRFMVGRSVHVSKGSTIRSREKQWQRFELAHVSCSGPSLIPPGFNTYIRRGKETSGD